MISTEGRSNGLQSSCLQTRLNDPMNPRSGRTISAGGFLQGEVGLGVDPFFYFERLAMLPGMPALIYTWHIDEITMNSAPYVMGTDRIGQACWVLDLSKIAHDTVESTSAATPCVWTVEEEQDADPRSVRSAHPSHWISYTLHCTVPGSGEPTHSRNGG